MADARDEGVWTYHAREHRDNETPHVIADNDPFRVRVLNLKEEVTKVLDLGCGSALWRHVFDGFEYYGADQNNAMIQVAESRFPDDKFYVTNGMNLVFDAGSFDMVFTASVLQHNKHADKELVLKEINRVLRPGGYYFCTENTFREDNYVGSYSPNVTDGYSFTPAGWEKFVCRFGFEIVWYQSPSEYLYRKVSDV